MIRKSFVVINKNCLSFLPQTRVKWRESEKSEVEERNNSEVRKLAEEYRFQLFSVPSFISITNLGPISPIFSLIILQFQLFSVAFNRSVNEIIQSTAWSVAIKQQIKDGRVESKKKQQFKEKKQESLRSHRLRSFVFSFVENELDFFFHLHFFDILTGKKNTHRYPENRLGDGMLKEPKSDSF